MLSLARLVTLAYAYYSGEQEDILKGFKPFYYIFLLLLCLLIGTLIYFFYCIDYSVI